MAERRSDFVEEAARIGVENMRFTIPCRPLRGFMCIGYTDSSDAVAQIECRVSEERYKVAEGYKITLVPLDTNYASESFYQADLISMMRGMPDLYYLHAPEIRGWRRVVRIIAVMPIYIFWDLGMTLSSLFSIKAAAYMEKRQRATVDWATKMKEKDNA